MGEHFQLTLTCAVLDTDKVKVVVDESSLAPTALHLVPFEIVSGTRFRGEDENAGYARNVRANAKLR